MTIRRIVTHPDDLLRKVSEPVDTSVAPDQDLIGDLIDTLDASMGAGLSAIQIGIAKRLAVFWGPGGLLAMANPVITSSEGEIQRGNLDQFSSEGCLSIPMEMFKVPRAAKVVVEYYSPKPDGTWEKKTETFERIHAQIVQHELDHMNGKLIVDYMDERNQNRIRGRLKKLKEKGFVFPKGAV